MKEGPSPPRHGRLRRLSAEEIALWLSVTRQVSPRPGSSVPAVEKVAPASASARPKEAEPVLPQKSAVVARPALPNLSDLDRRLRQKLARGQTPVDASIDLHGMRQQQAHAALQGFLHRAQRGGAKVVLIVTGKGESRDEFGMEAAGVLRRSVPHWLRAPEWRSLVVGFDEASRHHGGGGALYVRLRRLDRAKDKRRGL